MRAKSPPLSCRFFSLSVGLAAVLLAPRSQAQGRVFTFNPPDGVVYHHTVKSSQTTDQPTQGRMTESAAQKSRVVIKRDPPGFRITDSLLSASASVNGRAVKLPPSRAGVNLPFILNISSEGKLLSVRGAEAWAKRLSASQPTEPRLRAENIPREDVEAMVRSMWNSRVVPFVGRRVETGASWSVPVDFALPMGSVVSGVTTVNVTGEVPCKAGACVRARLTYTVDPETLKIVMEDFISRLIQQSGRTDGPPFSLHDIRLTETTDVVLDPATMLFYSASSSSNMQMSMNIADEVTFPILVVRKVNETFDYNPKPLPSPVKRVKPKPVRRSPKRR